MVKIVVVLLASAALAFSQNPAQRLRDIHKIYVGDFGTGDNAKLLRERIRIRLSQSKRLEVVASPEKADGVLSGETQFNLSAPIPNARVDLNIMNTDMHDLWTRQIEEQDPNRQAVIENLAKETCKAILKDIEKDDKAP